MSTGVGLKKEKDMRVSLPSMLLVLFIGLKLTGYIAWSWVWVLSPLWIPLVVFGAIFFFALFMAFLTKQL